MVSKEERLYFSDVLKRRIIQEVLSGSISKEGARRQYGIRGKSAILKWMRKFGYAPNFDSITFRMKSKELPKDPEQLKHRIVELEKALEEAKLSSKFYSTMIDVAEKEFKIPIRKKSVTKQSKK